MVLIKEILSNEALTKQPPIDGGMKEASEKQLKVYPIARGDAWWMDRGVETSNFVEADLVIFPGGADINPALYAEPSGKHTHFSAQADKNHIEFFKSAKESGKKMLGICRGLQLLHVMAGGKLVQHINHPNNHGLITYDGLELRTNSLHHQQVMFDGLKEGVDYKLLAWAKFPSSMHLNGSNKDYDFGEDYKDPEVVYYPKINAIGIQGHPEFQGMPQVTKTWLEDQIMKYLFTD